MARKVASADAVAYLAHHVFLPPKLPQADDFDAGHERFLLDVVCETLRDFRGHLIGTEQVAIDEVALLVRNMATVHTLADGCVDEEQALSALTSLNDGTGGDIALNIREQNAGILVSKAENHVQFQMFELSPNNSAIYAHQGRLQRSFPGCAVGIKLDESDLRKTIAQTLSRMSYQKVQGQQPQARKKGVLHDEERDTAHPGIVTEVYAGFLRAGGHDLQVHTILKNTREEVLWSNTLNPWRRSPMWLLVRIALQLTLARTDTLPQHGNALYKTFMVYFMSKALDLAHASASPELCYAMNAKLARRMIKLQSTPNSSIVAAVQKVMQDTTSKLESIWSRIQQQDMPRFDKDYLAAINPQGDTFISLPQLDRHIESITSRLNSNERSAFKPKSLLSKYNTDSLPNLRNLDVGSKEERTQNLDAFEQWVAAHLDNWLSVHLSEDRTCVALETVTRQYHAVAARHYSGNPEAVSVMALTTFELWVACDKSAVSKCTLISDYKPGIPSDVLQNLLLPLKDQSERLRNVELYLQRRASRSHLQFEEVFMNLSTDCFAVRYFNQSDHHQTMRSNIQDEATRSRSTKVQELRTLKTEYDDLKDQSRRHECEYFDFEVRKYRNTFTQRRHSKYCTKCALEKQAKALVIDLHEWPIPDNDMKARAVVFELDVPSFFASWRELTAYMLFDTLKAKHSAAQSARSARYPLRSDVHLRNSYQSPSTAKSPRIVLLSQDKAHVTTHRDSLRVSTATEDSVCVRNGLNYQYFDSESDVFFAHLTFTDSLALATTYQLPHRSRALQKYIYRPATEPNGPPSNTVIARQDECPAFMSLGEYKELCSLSLGHAILVDNIALQLVSPGVDFRKFETVMMITQCLLQSGPPGSDFVRPSFATLTDDVYGDQLLHALEEALVRVRENWESSLALSIFIRIANRILSLTSSATIRADCISFLRNACNVAFGWVTSLREQAQKCTEHKERILYVSRSVEIALICADTFNVDDQHLAARLESDDQSSTLLQCSIIVQEGKHALVDHSTNHAKPIVEALSMRFSRLLLRALHLLRSRQSVVSDAIAKSWTAFRPDQGEWTLVPDSGDHWLSTESDGLQVHINLLSGELLVNGTPLDRLPKPYEENSLYRTLFGSSAIEVMPAVRAGF